MNQDSVTVRDEGGLGFADPRHRWMRIEGRDDRLGKRAHELNILAAMSASISIEQYIATSYRPDCEYLEGVLVERRGGEWRHSRTQAVVGSILANLNEAQQWGLIVLISPRVRVAPTRVRIPDLALVANLDETRPPVLAIEIVSPEDTFGELAHRCSEYLQAGVRAAWLIDPDARTGHVWTDLLRAERTILEVPGTPIKLDLAEVFSECTCDRGPEPHADTAQ
jgi:Uma2 family endonuclease